MLTANLEKKSTMNLWSSQKTVLELPDAHITYVTDFLKTDEAHKLFEHLKHKTNWHHDDITLFGKTYKQPRLTALYAETNKTYTYSNVTMHPEPMSSELLSIKKKIEIITESEFNSVLLNLYRHGQDSNGWHADNEKELGKNPVIASLTLGAQRVFHFKHRTVPNEKYKIQLEHGSLLIMAGEMQQYWLHCIPKSKKTIGERINLTFRLIL